MEFIFEYQSSDNALNSPSEASKCGSIIFLSYHVLTTSFQVVQRTSGRAISSTNDSLQKGEYDIQCESKCSHNDGMTTLLTAIGEIRMTDETFVQRVITSNQSGKANEFTYGIRMVYRVRSTRMPPHYLGWL